MNNIEVDYFKASFTSDGVNGDLEVDNNGEIFYKKLDEEDLMKLINITNNQSLNKSNLLEELKREFPLKQNKKTTKKHKSNKKDKKNKPSKKSKTSKKSESIESIDSVFD